MSFTDPSSEWIWAYKSGNALSSDSIDASIEYHDEFGTANLNLQTAAGGASNNPFVSASAVSTPGQSSSGASTSATGTSEAGKVLIAHGVLASLAYVILFPSGAIAIRIFSFRNLLWLHAGWMVAAYMIVLASLGMGVWMAYSYHALDTAHSVIGIIVAGCLLLQPISGLTHHILYKRHGRRNVATYPHVWWGRAVISLGIINGGLGLKLADNSRGGEIAYGVVAGFMWILWMGVILLATVKSRRQRGGSMNEYGNSVIRENSSTEVSYFHNKPLSHSIQEADNSTTLPISQHA